eukprot:SAG11_NODE_19124_length_473_cov_3.564171_1_plen_69_part_01
MFCIEGVEAEQPADFWVAYALPDFTTSTLARTSRRADEDGDDDLLASVWAHGVSSLQGCGSAGGELGGP